MKFKSVKRENERYSMQNGKSESLNETFTLTLFAPRALRLCVKLYSN